MREVAAADAASRNLLRNMVGMRTTKRAGRSMDGADIVMIRREPSRFWGGLAGCIDAERT